MSELEKMVRFGYTFAVVDSRKTPTNRHVHQGIYARSSCSAPGAGGLISLEKRTCEVTPQGNSLRRVPVCGTGWSRNSTSSDLRSESKSKASANKIAWSHGTKSKSFRYRANLASEQRPIFSVLATRPPRFRTACVLRMDRFSFDFSFGER